MKVRYMLACMNAWIDGMVIDDFSSEEEAIRYAADYEARLYRVEEDGRMTEVWKPGQDD